MLVKPLSSAYVLVHHQSLQPALRLTLKDTIEVKEGFCVCTHTTVGKVSAGWQLLNAS